AGPVVGTAVRVPKTAGVKKQEKSGVAISWGFIVMVGSVVLIVGLVIAFIFGPLRVSKQWDGMIGDADSAVSDVVALGMQFHETGGVIDPKAKGHYSPQVREGTRFLKPFLVMSLPDAIDIIGTTNEGEFKGKYFTKTGEV